ncbi:hypothetical protein VTN00DRAFT_367 [Thermoascus crustaceus]|uniref:uncharacterized protein n=1 Tax=Thermoascus crustaceus TaxID=5088 RepID=UPI003742987F
MESSRTDDTTIEVYPRSSCFDKRRGSAGSGRWDGESRGWEEGDEGSWGRGEGGRYKPGESAAATRRRRASAHNAVAGEEQDVLSLRCQSGRFLKVCAVALPSPAYGNLCQVQLEAAELRCNAASAHPSATEDQQVGTASFLVTCEALFALLQPCMTSLRPAWLCSKGLKRDKGNPRPMRLRSSQHQVKQPWNTPTTASSDLVCGGCRQTVVQVDQHPKGTS